MTFTPNSSCQRYFARTLYDGSGAPAQHEMVIELKNGWINRVVPFRRGMGDLQEYDIVTPGLVDIQINGANDVQFNDDTSVDAIRLMAEGARTGGTAWILPTFVTAQGRSFAGALAASRQAIREGVEGVLGLHLEGPFLSRRRPGIHPVDAIRAIEELDLMGLTERFDGCLLLTVAPEEMPSGSIERLVSSGVVVFAGHSEAIYADMKAAESAGLLGATHLFNAMSQIQGREPGVVGAVFDSKVLFAGIIADGHHVHWSNVAQAIKLMPDRLCLVTDAMCTLAGSRKEFSMRGETIRLRDGRLTSRDGTLAGAHVAMDESIRNLLDNGLASPELAIRLASANPAAALGLSDKIGSIKAGQRASLTFFDRDWRTKFVETCSLFEGRERAA